MSLGEVILVRSLDALEVMVVRLCLIGGSASEQLGQAL